MPAPALVRLPGPLIAIIWVRLPERLKIRLALFTIEGKLDQFSDPVVPPLPICNVPSLIVMV